MEELRKKLEAMLVDLQDAHKQTTTEVDNFEPEEGEEDSTSPWEDADSYVGEAAEALENAINAFPSE